jgi:hypothetical protein
MKLSVSFPGYVRKSSGVLRTYQRLQFAPVLSIAMSYVICLLFSHSYRLLLNEFKVVRHKSVFKCLDNMLLQASSDFSHAVPLCSTFLYTQHFFSPACLTLILWKWRQHIPPKYHYIPTSPHVIKPQKVAIFMVTAMSTSNCTWQKWSVEVNEWTLLGMGEWQGFQEEYWEEEVISKKEEVISKKDNGG